MKKFKSILLIAILFTVTLSYAQKRPLNAYVIGFYNLENLFDTIDDPIKNDAQFLPNGDYAWGTLKYTNKLQKMAYAISQMPKNLAILGVSEIENINVLEDLVKEPAILNRNLKPILVEGPDRRGIDVGLLYNSKLFTPTNVTSTRITTELENFFTRDQLCVSGILDGEEIHIIVNHWPSRSGGEKRSKPRRAEAARTTKLICDSLFALNPNAKIVVMGDLNDDPIDPSVTEELGAKSKIEQTKPGELFNTTYAFYKQGIGTLAYQDQWNLFDQIIISHAWLNKNRKTLSYWKTEIFNKDFLKQQEGRYKGYPLRTHSGGVWTNGYSDHFPCLIWVVKYK
ncbi:MAG: endonuclease/exonuclease/phosphatase family protein [Paludibacteraceae bacterium]|nr:endonuclease/exonuclease/phosphatase family protein [Paludibacteraceae bacterium]